MTEPTPDLAKRRSALSRYRVMAIITGTFLLLVTLGVVLKYVVKIDNPTFVSVTSAIAIVHGWIYVVYLVTSVDLWTRMKWTLGRLLFLAAGGVIPGLSFVAERRVSREVAGTLDS